MVYHTEGRTECLRGRLIGMTSPEIYEDGVQVCTSPDAVCWGLEKQGKRREREVMKTSRRPIL